jgi:hypothetical protein
MKVEVVGVGCSSCVDAANMGLEVNRQWEYTNVRGPVAAPCSVIASRMVSWATAIVEVAPSSMELFLIRGGEVGRTEALRPVRFSSGTLPYSWCVMRSHRVAPLVLGSV